MCGGGRGLGGASEEEEEEEMMLSGGQVVKVRRTKLEACMTCPLCKNYFTGATTISECLHTFCRKCIYDKITDEELNSCPVCYTGLGCAPLEKLRADHSLQDLRDKIFPPKKQKAKASEPASSVSKAAPSAPEAVPSPHRRKERSLHSLATTIAKLPANKSVLHGKRARKDPALQASVVPVGQIAMEVDGCEENASSPETLNKTTETKGQGKEPSSTAGSSKQTTSKDSEESGTPSEGKADLLKPLRNIVLVEAPVEMMCTKPNQPKALAQRDELNSPERSNQVFCSKPKEPSNNVQEAKETAKLILRVRNKEQRNNPPDARENGQQVLQPTVNRQGYQMVDAEEKDKQVLRPTFKEESKGAPSAEENDNQIISPNANQEDSRKPKAQRNDNQVLHSYISPNPLPSASVSTISRVTDNGYTTVPSPSGAVGITSGVISNGNSSNPLPSCSGETRRHPGVQQRAPEGSGSVQIKWWQGVQKEAPDASLGSTVPAQTMVNVSSRRGGRFSPIWFSLVAANNQNGGAPLPQLPSRYLRVKDGSIPVSFIRKYIARKLGLASESEVEISARGQPVLPTLQLHNLVEWWMQTAPPSERVQTATVGGSGQNFVMVLTYSRKAA